MNLPSLEHQKRKSLLMTIGIGTLLLIMFSGLYLWHVVPSEQLLSVDDTPSIVELDTFVGSILETPLH